MAPFPDEIDVFTGPHSRMKELVEVYSVKLHCTDFSNNEALESLLNSLNQTFSEFKTHEQIENQFIMKKLKTKLKALRIHDSSVCNCHNDSQLTDMLALVKDGYSCTRKSQSEKINYGVKLQNALEEFTKEFLPHMQEEEEVFQPMLMKYFGYEELKSLRELVLLEHFKCRIQNQNSQEKHCLEPCEKSPSEKKNSQTKEALSKTEDYISRLPSEILSHIFTFLTPRDLIRSSAVNKLWNQTAYNKNLWTQLFPTRWTKGFWSFHEFFEDTPTLESQPSQNLYCEYQSDEDADVDESAMSPLSFMKPQRRGYLTVAQKTIQANEKIILKALVQHVLPRVGVGVKVIHLAYSTGISNNLLRSILILCPNLTHLDVSNTNIGDLAFKGLSSTNACRRLEHVDLSGSLITDCGLLLFANCFVIELTKCASQCAIATNHERSEAKTSTKYDNNSKWLSKNYKRQQFPCHVCPLNNYYAGNRRINTKIKFLSLSGCYKITDIGLNALTKMGLLAKVQHLDFSGCYQLSGPAITNAVEKASELLSENLYYCSEILDGPYVEEANGCQNLGGNERFCCRLGD